MMHHEPTEVLSAFLDGEHVEPADLAEALATPGALDTLRDFARIRAELDRDPSRPSAAFYDRMRDVVGPPERSPRRRWLPLPVPAPVLAAMLAAALGIGVLATYWLLPSGRAETPPKPDRVIAFVEGVDWNAK